MKTQLIKIVAVSVDTAVVTLYTPEGDVVTLSQGDLRIPPIIDAARANAALLNSGGFIEVDIAEVVAERTEYTSAEKGTNGVVRFFRMAKKVLKELMDTESPEQLTKKAAMVSPLEIGVLPGLESLKEEKPAPAPTYDVSVIAFRSEFNKVGAIKFIREHLGIGLREAKDFVEQPLPIVIMENVDHETYLAMCKEASEFFILSGYTPEPVKEETPAPAPVSNQEKLDVAADRMRQIMDVGTPTSDPGFHKPLNEEEETIVAVHTTANTVVPDAHRTVPQLKSAEKLQNYVGYTRFLERLQLIINDRAHSIEDLMKFIGNGDLPIADDGCIVIYKRLNQRTQDTFVDVHSGGIQQKVGSFVFMRAGLVDPSRRNDCSNGLHVASLSYLGSFSGNVTVIAKVRPEDVFAVPQYNTNKMRVSGYHILAKLPENLRNLVNRGGSISSDPEGAILLNNVLRGNHVKVTQTVEVGGNNGTKVTITDISVNSQSDIDAVFAPVEVKNTTIEQAVPDSELPEVKADAVDPTKLDVPVKVAEPEKVEEVKAKAAKTNKLAQQAAVLLAQLKEVKTSDEADSVAKQLISFKSQSKKSWGYLNISANDVSFIMSNLARQVNVKADAIQAEAKAVEKRKENNRNGGKGGPSAQIRELLDNRPLTKSQYQAILLIKKKAKKGWTALGVSAQEQAEIETATAK